MAVDQIALVIVMNGPSAHTYDNAVMTCRCLADDLSESLLTVIYDEH